MSASAAYADWIAVDWGTSHLRAWAMTDAGAVRDEARSERGMGTLAPAEFEPALLELVEPWLGAGRTLIVACGMLGSRQGWTEAPYSTVPCKPLSLQTISAPVRDPRLTVRIVPGLRQTTPAADVMRGEETQIAGYLATRPGFDGVLCLPGTHTKWAEISAGEVVSFRTFMTGELFALLSGKSILAHSVKGGGWDDDAFAEAVDDTLARPEALAAKLFNIRAEGLLGKPDSAVARARLSGLLLGAELAAARPYWLGREVALVGAPDLTAVYARALARQGLDAAQADGSEMTRAGLARIRARLAEEVR